jgi:bis(5'-nucleosidyl)-tetraphosphatase
MNVAIVIRLANHQPTPAHSLRPPFLYTWRMTPRSPRLSAGVVVLRQSPEGWRLLLLRAFNHWDFPKGMVEAGEEPLAAAIREVQEESLISDLEFAWGESSTQTGPYSRGKVARYFIARTNTADVTLPVNPELGRPEHSEFRWVSFDEAMELVSPRVRPVLNWAAQVANLGAD